MKKEIENFNNGLLTNTMDIGTKGFDEFQAILLKESNSRNANQIRNIELLSLKFEMEDYIKSNNEEIKSAGYFLKHFLKSLQIKQNSFAQYIGIKPSNLSKLINGERSINYDLALIFGKIFNHKPILWIEIQAKNELYKLTNTNKGKYYQYSLNDLFSGQKHMA